MDLYLGELEQLILLALVRLDDNAYGVTIRQAFLRTIGKLICPMNLYAPFARDDTITQAALFLSVACILAPLHARENSRTLPHFLSVQPPAREMAAELLRVQPQVKRGAHVLFVDDPFPRDQYFLLFLTRLLYHDMTIEVTRTSVQPCPVAQYRNYDVVLLYRRGNLLAWRAADRIWGLPRLWRRPGFSCS